MRKATHSREVKGKRGKGVRVGVMGHCVTPELKPRSKLAQAMPEGNQQ